jgi:hypothetical protein
MAMHGLVPVSESPRRLSWFSFLESWWSWPELCKWKGPAEVFKLADL